MSRGIARVQRKGPPESPAGRLPVIIAECANVCQRLACASPRVSSISSAFLAAARALGMASCGETTSRKTEPRLGGIRNAGVSQRISGIVLNGLLEMFDARLESKAGPHHGARRSRYFAPLAGRRGYWRRDSAALLAVQRLSSGVLLIPRPLSSSNPGTVAYRRGVGGLPPSNRRAEGAGSKSSVVPVRRKQTLGLVRA
jgi:hypothetical protein